MDVPVFQQLLPRRCSSLYCVLQTPGLHTCRPESYRPGISCTGGSTVSLADLCVRKRQRIPTFFLSRETKVPGVCTSRWQQSLRGWGFGSQVR